MSICFRFKNELRKFERRLPCDGPYLMGADVKNQIIQMRAAGKDYNFELVLYNEQTQQVYGNQMVIPRDTCLIVHRIPRLNKNSNNNNAPTIANVSTITPLEGKFVHTVFYGGSSLRQKKSDNLPDLKRKPLDEEERNTNNFHHKRMKTTVANAAII